MSTKAVPPELQQHLLKARAELQAVKAREAALQRSKQLAELTRRQVAAESPGTVWQGVGKMFKQIPVAEFDERVDARTQDLDAQLEALKKKEQYFATTLDKLMLAITGDE